MRLLKWLQKPMQLDAAASSAQTIAQDKASFPTIILPTRNRPTSLASVLGYIGKFYPGAKVVVADGSVADFQNENETLCARAATQIEMDYRAYSPELPVMSRIRTVLESLPEDHYVFGADDDFPVLEVLAEAKAFLAQNSDYSLCGGYNFLISMNRKGKTRTMMFSARSIEDERASARCRRYADLDFPTYYCVATRSHFLSRYDRLDEGLVTGFADYMLGFHDLMQGKLRILDNVSYIRTANATHSYLRVTNRLNFLHDAASVLALKEQIARDLKVTDDAMSVQDADTMSEDFIFERIRFLTRSRAVPDPETPESAAFHALLKTPDSLPARIFSKRIDYILEQLRIIQASSDNKGEVRRRSSIDA